MSTWRPCTEVYGNITIACANYVVGHSYSIRYLIPRRPMCTVICRFGVVYKFRSDESRDVICPLSVMVKIGCLPPIPAFQLIGLFVLVKPTFPAWLVSDSPASCLSYFIPCLGVSASLALGKNLLCLWLFTVFISEFCCAWLSLGIPCYHIGVHLSCSALYGLISRLPLCFSW